MCFRIALLTKEEWTILSRCYAADYGVYLYFGELGMFTTSTPGNYCISDTILSLMFES